jgi:LacI family transcriptional regulator
VVLLNVDQGTAALASVRTDDDAGGRIAARHLRERGHQRIGVITNFPAASPHRERLAGLAAGGVDGDPALTLVLAGYRPSAAERLACRALASRCSALVLTSGYLFTALLGDLAACGRRIGDDLALLVYDDFEALSAHHPPVSAIRQPLGELAALAVAMVGDAAKGLPLACSVQLIAPQLVVRDSTLGPLRSGARRRIISRPAQVQERRQA